MGKMPDGNTAALRIYEFEQERAERLYGADDAVAEAQEQIQDPDGLKKLLNDEELAPALAEAFASLEAASLEAAAHDLPSVHLVLNRLARLERICFNFAMGDE